MVFIHKLEPFPAKIGQSEKQQVVYKGNTYFFSPYEVKEQKTIVKLPSSTIESFSRLKPTSSNDNTVTYGPYKNAKPFKSHEMRVHFENNAPFLTVNEMTRWLEISHWGNIAVEETYHLIHQGAKLKVCCIYALQNLFHIWVDNMFMHINNTLSRCLYQFISILTNYFKFSTNDS